MSIPQPKAKPAKKTPASPAPATKPEADVKPAKKFAPSPKVAKTKFVAKTSKPVAAPDAALQAALRPVADAVEAPASGASKTTNLGDLIARGIAPTLLV